MPQDVSTIVRGKISTGNRAVEFLETRADRVIGAEHRVPSEPEPQYDPIRDEFMSPQDIDKINYFETSTTKMQQLEISLANLNATIRKQKYDKKLNITLKDPKTYKVNEVLEIASKIEKNHRNANNTKTAMGLIRRCFRSVGEDQGNMKRFLSFVPGDIYGSVISGAFAMVLGSAEHAGSIRNSIYDALTDIPLKLKEIQDLGEVYYRSAALRAAADSVLVAIFSILDCCVDELTKDLDKKLLGHFLRGDGYASKVKEAIQSLEKAMSDFGRYARIDMHKRLGRTEIKGTRAMLAAENTEQIATGMNRTVKETNIALKGLDDRFAQFEKRLKDDMENLEARLAEREAGGQAIVQSIDPQELDMVRNQTIQTIVYNQFYTLFTSSPIYDPQTGSARHDLLESPQTQRENAVPSDSGAASLQQAKINKKTMNAWMRYLKPAHYPVNKYMEDCLENFMTLSLEVKDQIQWIMTSSEIREWLRSTQSEILILESQTHLDDLYNAVTFSAALLRKLLKRFDYPILCAFCGLRANDSINEGVSGPGPMVASLLAQLFTQIEEKRPEAIVTGIGNLPEDLVSPQNLVEKLQYVLEVLPERDTVFIILDCVEYLSGDDPVRDLAVELLLKLTQVTKVTVKIAVTGIVSPVVLDKFEYQMLFIPDFVDGRSQGVHHEFYQGRSLQAILDFDEDKKKDATLEEIESDEDLDDLEGWV